VILLSGGLFWLTTGINGLAIVGAGLMLLSGASDGPRDFLHAGLPLLLAGGLVAAGAGVGVFSRGRGPSWLSALSEGVAEATRALGRPSWRLAGAVGYLAFDIAVLWATFEALGYDPPVAALMLGYLIGYLGALIPVPGGLGVLEGGIGVVLIAYGLPPAQTVAAVLVYHAIAFWVPTLGGLIAYHDIARRGTDSLVSGTPARPARETIR
jgi:uncharacterized membrane protein YbhN (UPF0104 family)